jgi:tetratricopeptide (TPR) repeat protein
MSETLTSVAAAIESGRMLDAWEKAQASGVQLAAWPHGEARRIAARLIANLGDGRQGRALDWLNWRQDRAHPKWYFHALFTRAEWRTPQELMVEIEGRLRGDMPDESRAELMAYLAWSHSALRDFKPAHEMIAQALKLDPRDAWLHVQHASILVAHDRYEEALEVAHHARRLQPYHRPSVLQSAEVLVHLGRDDEALEILLDSHLHSQQAAFTLKMQVIYSEREDHERALWCLEEAERLSPLATESWKKWIAGRRADFLYMAGDLDGCLEWCDRKGEGFQKEVAKHLREPGARDRRRVKLDVPFVRQHRMTCAPATLSALSAFWGKKHDHLEIADAICHEGTPWHREREWAMGHGFMAREFRLTPAILRELIDRGLPFTLTTQWTTGAHLQACIGYDDRTGVILLRDPTERHYGEMLLAGLIADHPVGGPRGMVMVPVEEAARLDGLLLPDEAAYEANHELLLALDGHDRWKVEAAVTTLRAVAPGSALALQGEARVAGYLRDWPRELAATEALLERFPSHGPLLLRKSTLLEQLGRRAEQRALLEKSLTGGDAVFVSELGELLLDDARELPLAEHHLKRALRQRRCESRCHESLARCRDKQHRHAESAALRRAAASLSPSSEGYSRAYFDTCRILKRTDEALDFLRERTRVHGRKDGGPWITLATCLDAVRNDREAVAVLEDARAMRPDDGALLLEAGGLMAGWGGELRERGRGWVEAARGKVPEIDWLRKSAQFAGFTGDRPLAIQRWRGLLKIQPLADDAWRALVRLVAEEEGEDAALALLDEATARFPDQVALWSLQAEWRRRRPEGPLAALDRMLELDPRDRWALRERALRRVDAGRKDEALADVREAVALDPRDGASHGILASVLKDCGHEAEARESLMAALRLDIDYTWAARELMDLSIERTAAREALYFLEVEMRRQVSNGNIVPVYQEIAWRLIEPPVLLGKLQGFCKERPDLWQTGSARIEQALRMRMDTEAQIAAETLTGSFPLLPRAWMDLAKVHRAAGRHEDEEQALARAVDLSPGWDEVARTHAEVLERLGRLPEAGAVLRRALLLEPLNGPNYGVLADFLRRTGQREEAIGLLRKAGEICPFYHWGWETRARWAHEDGAEEEVASALREAAVRHGQRRAWWPLAADAWDALGRRDEAIAAIRRGLELSPDDMNLRDQLAYHLCAAGSYEDALKACETVNSTREIEGRRAWILMQSGQPVKAIEAMQELLDREPDYAWGMGELAGWLSRRSDWSRLRELARKWVRISPRETRALGYLGQAERELGNAEEAKKAYARAHSLDPDYIYAGRQLADIQMELGEFEQAAATITLLRHYAPGPDTTSDAIELALKRGNVADALIEAEALLTDEAAGSGNFEWIATLFERVGRGAAWTKWLEEKIAPAPVVAPGALVGFLRSLPEKRQFKEALRWITREPAGSPARVAAWSWLLTHAGKQRRADLLLQWSKSHRAELHDHGTLWNEMGSALLEVSSANDGVDWFRDWKKRDDDVNASTLVNLAALYEASSGDHDRCLHLAAEVREVALERFPGDRNSPALRAGLALLRAIDGRIDDARELLGQFESGLTSGYYQEVARLAGAIVATADGRESEAIEQARNALVFFAKYPGDPAMQRLRTKAESALLRHQPWAAGKIRRLRKRWALPDPGKAGGGEREWMKPAGWIAFVIIFALLRSCGSE